MYNVEKQKAMPLFGEDFTICMVLEGVRFLGSGMEHISLE